MKPAVRIVRALLRGMLGLAATLVLGVVTLLYLSIDSKPLVFGAASLTHAHIERAKRLLRPAGKAVRSPKRKGLRKPIPRAVCV